MRTLLAICSSFLCGFPCEAAPRHVYLTWQGDTSTTITVNYQTIQKTATNSVFFDTQSHGQKIGEYRFHANGTSRRIEGLPDGRLIHWIQLTNLKPGQTYFFVAGDAVNGFTAERKFQTIPSKAEKLRFVEGGDMGTSASMTALLKQAALQEPNFAVVGGDIAYAGDQLTNYLRWDTWLYGWEEFMITPAGLTIPMVLAIGNHEVRGGSAPSPANAQFYLRYFAQHGERTYYSRKFGNILVLYLLDSGHLTRHGGEQAAWLDKQLEADSKFTHRFAVHHVPLYPAYRPFEGAGSAAGRSAWLSIFDKHHLETAFEHHDHVFKRTKLLRNNQADPQGTLYLGDGCWGQRPRVVAQDLRWYEEKAASIQHFWRVDVSPSRVEYRAINSEGKIFDVYPPDATGADEAEKVYDALTPAPASRPTQEK